MEKFRVPLAALGSPRPEAPLTRYAFALAIPMPLAAFWALDPGKPGMSASLSQAVLELVPSVPS